VLQKKFKLLLLNDSFFEKKNHIIYLIEKIHTLSQ